MEKVSQWRRLYKGIATKDGKKVQESEGLTLEEAANKVGVSKKSLDDYLLQLRFGIKFKFDFKTNSHEKVGVLRNFVKKEKDKLKGGQKGVKISSKCDDEDLFCEIDELNDIH